LNPDWIIPHWPAPENVRALSTTRAGGHSTGAWRGLNLGLHCGDEPAAVLKNRKVLRACLPAEPHWLRQEHGVAVFSYPEPVKKQQVNESRDQPALPILGPAADAQVAFQPAQICAVLTADCLPVLFCNRSGTKVAAAHAGWRGLAAGVLEMTVQALGEPPDQLLAWLGPAIGARAYEVGDDVRTAFVRRDSEAEVCFRRTGEHWMFDLYAMARRRLAQAGLAEVSGGTYCTYSEPERFFSYRRDGQTGRMASLVWLQA